MRYLFLPLLAALNAITFAASPLAHAQDDPGQGRTERLIPLILQSEALTEAKKSRGILELLDEKEPAAGYYSFWKFRALEWMSSSTECVDEKRNTTDVFQITYVQPRTGNTQVLQAQVDELSSSCDDPMAPSEIQISVK